jgi:hypothetical protein
LRGVASKRDNVLNSRRESLRQMAQKKITPINHPRLAYSLEEFRQAIGGVSDRFLRYEIARGNLHATRIGRKRLLITAAEAARYLAQGGEEAEVRG